jgi:glycosyltransferase involved in cell wall biosynthesis
VRFGSVDEVTAGPGPGCAKHTSTASSQGTDMHAADQMGLFVLPEVGQRRLGPVAAWITTGGLACAAERRYGHAQILSPRGLQPPKEALRHATQQQQPGRRAAYKRHVPEAVITAAKDARSALRAPGAIDLELLGPGTRPLRFVWQRHELFHHEGLTIARRFGTPLVLSVHAVQVDEAAGWGVRRPGWGRALRWASETRKFHSADVVTAVSDEVAASIASLGIDERKLLVLPNGVDTDAFTPTIDGGGVRARLGIAPRELVVGWSGSFRTFHGLDTALEAIAQLQRDDVEIALLLLGDGLGRQSVAEQAQRLGIRRLIMPGTVAYEKMPSHLAAMDIALVLAAPGQPFHYSPVKLREYAASGKAILGHEVGQIAKDLKHGRDCMLVPAGDAAALAEAIRLLTDPRRRHDLGSAAARKAQERWSWDTRLGDLDEFLARSSSIR